jgi:hypothetical protein
MFKKLPYIFLSLSVFAGAVPAGQMGSAQSPQGFFIGLGANYSAVRIQQDSWGMASANSYTSGLLDSTGIAQGNAAPFQNTSLTLAPEIQAGYIKNYNADSFWGIKFTYQYLGLVFTNRDLYLPQTGELTTYDPTGTSALYGYVISDSVETKVNHNMNLLALIGKQWGNKSIYLGAGPSVISLRSQSYNSIGYAIIDDETLNVTGLLNYGSPTIWAWGGAAQIGMNYFINPTWFLDASYTYSVAGSYTSSHVHSFSHVVDADSNTVGTLATKDTFRTTSFQAVNLSINKIFDL